MGTAFPVLKSYTVVGWDGLAGTDWLERTGWKGLGGADWLDRETAFWTAS